MRNAYEILVEKSEEETSLERPSRRWKDIKINISYRSMV
jgi:hypothetical protein